MTLIVCPLKDSTLQRDDKREVGTNAVLVYRLVHDLAKVEGWVRFPHIAPLRIKMVLKIQKELKE